MHIAELHAADRYRQPGNLVLDVRSRHEHRIGHVPGSFNIPVSRIVRHPGRFAPALAPLDRVFVHCSSGARARRAYDALVGAGLGNLVLIERSGTADWARRGYPVERSVSLARDVLTGLGAGLVAQLAVSQVDRVLRSRISSRQKLREKLVREGSPHEVASARYGLAFTLGYGLLWGAIYALARRRMPQAGALLGAPFGVGFFLACDGVLAPLFRMGPGLRKVPAPFNAKELANHVAWTATAEAVHRGLERMPR